jgi:Na+/H+ antiporter NhaD/arsenite permease-like protein
MFRAADKEQYLLPVLTFENIAAIRGSLLTPFGSPQNLYLFSKSGISVKNFLFMMMPLWVASAILLLIFIFFLYRKNPGEQLGKVLLEENIKGNLLKQIVHIVLFVIVIASIVTRTPYWPFITLFVFLALVIFDYKILLKTDYVLILTFLCFFVFSSSIYNNPKISTFLSSSVAHHEYLWSILLSQFISNVPASIVLWPFSKNLKALLYGLDSAGLCSIIGSLASVINLRIYTKEYPYKALDFMKTFQIISLIFFAIVVIPQLLLIIFF